VRAMLAQATMELRLSARRGENVLVTLLIPLALLLFFGSTSIPGVGGPSMVAFLTPGVVALAIMSAGMVSLSIATAFERQYGVLKRLGGTPLTRAHLIGAKMLAVLCVEVIQIGLIAGVATIVLGWRPVGGLGLALAVALLGTVAFAALGLAMAGSLRAEAVLALANGLYLLFLLAGGLFLPLAALPPVVALVAPYLPSTALAALLRAALGGAGLPLDSLAVLVAWALAALLVAIVTFRWE
jgi:ABC-2 type transport system permease protein